jgi:hypothetical protein
MSAKLHAMKTAVKLNSMLVARFLCVVFRRMISRLIDLATNIKPVSAAAPLPTMTKKSFHCSSKGCLSSVEVPDGMSAGRRVSHARASADGRVVSVHGELSEGASARLLRAA